MSKNHLMSAKLAFSELDVPEKIVVRALRLCGLQGHRPRGTPSRSSTSKPDWSLPVIIWNMGSFRSPCFERCFCLAIWERGFKKVPSAENYCSTLLQNYEDKIAVGNLETKRNKSTKHTSAGPPHRNAWLHLESYIYAVAAAKLWCRSINQPWDPASLELLLTYSNTSWTDCSAAISMEKFMVLFCFLDGANNVDLNCRYKDIWICCMYV